MKPAIDEKEKKWKAIRDKAADVANYAKFSQHPSMKDKLLATKTSKIGYAIGTGPHAEYAL